MVLHGRRDVSLGLPDASTNYKMIYATLTAPLTVFSTGPAVWRRPAHIMAALLEAIT